MKTIAMAMEEKDPETFAFLQKMMVRPAVYFGTHRFSRMDLFFFGYTLERDSFELLPSWEIQRWLLHTYSASINSIQMNGQSLFYRVFGSRDIAFEHYKEFLEYCPPEMPEIPMDTAIELYCYENKQNLVRYDFEDDVPPGHDEQLANNALGEIKGMIARAGLAYDTLRVYVRREPLFVQVRFLLHAADGWMDDTALIAKEENHTALLALHANARDASAEALAACGCDVNDKVEYSNSWENCEIHDLDFLVTDETAFVSEYRRWREDVTGQRAAPPQEEEPKHAGGWGENGKFIDEFIKRITAQMPDAE